MVKIVVWNNVAERIEDVVRKKWVDAVVEGNAREELEDGRGEEIIGGAVNVGGDNLDERGCDVRREVGECVDVGECGY